MTTMADSRSGVVIEVCVDSVESAEAAVRGGADRLEVCANLGIGGGTTPSAGLIRSIAEILPNIPLMIMIRPRVGDFVYSQSEMKVILNDIEYISNLGVNGLGGFVCGVLKPDSTIDEEKTKVLVREVIEKRRLEFCFHRAFDMVPDQNEALKVLSSAGVTRILTSAGFPSLSHPSALEALASLLHHLPADSPPTHATTILPGSGISHVTVVPILRDLLPLGVREVHMSGGFWEEGKTEVSARKGGMGFGSTNGQEWSVWRTSEEKVRSVRQVIMEEWGRYESIRNKVTGTR